MPVTKKKTLKNDFKPIKLSAILMLALFLGLFVVGEVLGIVYIDESFETYPLGAINYQENWFPYNLDPNNDEYSMIVNNERASDGIKSIRGGSGEITHFFGSELWTTTTGSGIFSFDFLITGTPACGSVRFCEDFENCNPFVIKGNDEGYTGVNAGPYGTILLGDTIQTNVWHRISFEYNLDENWGRASYDFGEWSETWEILNGVEPDYYFNRYIFTRCGGVGYQPLYFDNFTNLGECNSTCLYCDYNNCLTYQGFCSWNTEESQCQPVIIEYPPLPELEDCEGLGVTDRLLCEIKNFFYRLFVPSTEKIIQLQTSLETIKTKFPYNYLLATKDFFGYLKDNITDTGDIAFSVLGNAGVVSFDVFNSTTTLAGEEQSFMGIFKTFLKFLVIMIFALWGFSFIKRIFK